MIILKQMVVTDFQLRYQGSALGYAWSLLKPLFMFAILYGVFGFVLKTGGSVDNFPVYLLLGILLWNFFAEVTTISVGAIVGKGDIIRKLNFPKFVLILSGVFSAMINLGISFIVMIIFMAISHVHISNLALLFPLLIIELVIFAFSIGLILSAMFVRYRDISYIWEIFLQIFFFFFSIIYTVDYVSNQSRLLAKIQMVNPLAQIIQDSRHLLVTPQAQTGVTIFGSYTYYLVPISIVILAMIFGVSYFRKKAPRFAEEV